MSTNIISVVGFKGISAKTLNEKLIRLRDNKIGDFSSVSSNDWTDQDHIEIENVISSIEKCKNNPPSFYSLEYLDSWSVAGSSMGSIKLPGIKKYIRTEKHNVAFFTDDDIPLIPILHKKIRRKNFYRNQREDRWFIDSINECAQAINWLPGPMCIIAYTKYLGGSVTDDMYKKSMNINVFD